MIGTHTQHRATRGKTLALCLSLTVLLTACALVVTGPALGAAYFVDSTADRSDERPGDGICSTGVRIVHDDGFIELECTLRAAIQEANAVAGSDTIGFGIESTEDSNCDPTTGVCTISPATPLPTIVRSLTTNGYSQPGASVNTATTGTNASLKIVLDGSGISSLTDGLVVTARSTTLRGLVIGNFRRFGVFFDGETTGDQGRTLEGCFVGTDVSGTQERSNGGGVMIDDGEGNVIGGDTRAARNIVSGNNDTGARLSAPARPVPVSPRVTATATGAPPSSRGPA